MSPEDLQKTITDLSTKMIQDNATVPVDHFVAAAIDAAVRCIRFGATTIGVNISVVEALDNLKTIIDAIRAAEAAQDAVTKH